MQVQKKRPKALHNFLVFNQFLGEFTPTLCIKDSNNVHTFWQFFGIEQVLFTIVIFFFQEFA